MTCLAAPAYTVVDSPAVHTCWDQPGWDGTIEAEGVCAGCDQAAQHPCRVCGYGHVFATHNDVCHAENGDLATPDVDDPTLDAWSTSPHLYAGEDVERV